MRHEDTLSCLALWTVAEARRQRQMRIAIEGAMAEHPTRSGPRPQPLPRPAREAPVRPSPSTERHPPGG